MTLYMLWMKHFVLPLAEEILDRPGGPYEGAAARGHISAVKMEVMSWERDLA